jgi:hypothetical protein
VPFSYVTIYERERYQARDRRSIGNDYDDDTAYAFGDQRIYLKRHILRAFEEAARQLLPLARGQ